jgi:hypothetical protein
MLKAKTHLSRLVEAIETGAEVEVVIARGQFKAAVGQAHHQQIHIRAGGGRAPLPAAELPHTFRPDVLHQDLQSRDQLSTQAHGQVAGLNGTGPIRQQRGVGVGAG